MTERLLDLAGIGIGPFNLSLAAHLDGIDGVAARFFDRQRGFDWHPGMMLPGVELQTSFLKDLVTPTNPTSPWSFMAYLVAHKRFYRFLNAEFEATPREEFADYLAWVAQGVPGLRFGVEVREVDFADGAFTVRFAGGERERARNIALGVGLAAHMPDWARPHLGARCFHSSQSAHRLPELEARRIAVVGGGQSGAEIVLHLLTDERFAGCEIVWLSRRANFQPLDDTPFTNELFTPDYVERFHGLAEGRKAAIVAHQKLAGDGISPSTLRALYRRLYSLGRRSQGEGPIAPMPHREVLEAEARNGEFRLVARNGFDGGIDVATVDAVVLATGYGFAVPDCLAPLRHRLAFDEHGYFRIGQDFAVHWDGPQDNRVFALNAGRLSHGIAEPQLSLMAWRSAIIANALLGRAHFDVEMPPPLVRWATGGEPLPSIETLNV